MFRELIKKKKIILCFCLFFLLSAGFLITPAGNFIFQEVKSKVKEIIASLNNRLIVFSQEIGPYVFPRYPQRLKYLSSEISLASEEILALNQELNQALGNCDCQYVQSLCYQPQTKICLASEIKVFGDPCPNRKEIEGIEGQITEKKEKLILLKKILEKEMETGLKRELETMDPERAEKLKKNLEGLLDKSSNITSSTEENRNLSINWRPQIKKVCQVHCQAGEVFELKACLKGGTAQQKPIDLKFKVGVGLDDLELGKVEIKNIGLNLPEKIQLAKPKDISIDIPGKEVIAEFKKVAIEELKKTGLLDLATPSFSLRTPQISIPEIPEMKLNFPTPGGASSYQCSTAGQTEEMKDNETNWYFQTFSWLSEKCQELPSMTSDMGPTEKVTDCFDPEKLPNAIIEQCNKIWTIPCTGLAPPDCDSVKYNCEQHGKMIAAGQCQNFFKERNKPIPASCQYETNEKEGIIFPPNFDAVKTIKIECRELLKEFLDKLLAEGKIDNETYAVCNVLIATLGPGSLKKCIDVRLSGIGVKLPQTCKTFDPITILESCNELWPIACNMKDKPFPEICKDTKFSCGQNGKMAATLHCQELFQEENELANPACLVSPIETLKNKCNELKKKGEEIPKSCKLLPLFTGKIEKPAGLEYSPQPIKCAPQTIADFPTGLDLPSIPKIHLEDIIIPDIKLPHWKLLPFLEIKLPSFIFEDLIFPEIELCDIDNCKNVFTDLKFQWPIISGLTLDIPPLRLPPLKVDIEGIGLIDVAIPEIKIGKILLPPIPFPAPEFPQLSLMTPELKLPEISMPKPKLLFSFEGIDMSWITDFIITLILNALGIPDFSLCVDFSLKIIPLRIIFPDYYFGWPAFPEIPQIPFCEKTNEFCKEVKTALRQVTDKQKEIESIINKAIQEKIQAKLNQISKEIETEISEKIEKILKEEAEALQEKIKAAIAASKIENGILKIPPVTHQIGDKKITIPWLEKFLANIPQTIPITWPENLKKIALNKPLTYELPTIPLDKLSYEKEIPIKLPGFQKRTFDLDLGSLEECLSQAASGGNPYSSTLNQIQGNLEKIKNIEKEINKDFQEINNILQW